MNTTKALFEGAPSETGSDSEYTYSPEEYTSALANVINYTLTDAFNLTSEESLLINYHLTEILAPLKMYRPERVMVAVCEEMKTKEYSERLFTRIERPTFAEEYPQAPEAPARYAPLNDWVESISEIILFGYPNLRPMVVSSLVGSIHGLMMELNIGDKPPASRASSYLPISVRYLMNTNEQNGW